MKTELSSQLRKDVNLRQKITSKLIFPKFAFFDVSAGQNTTLSYPKELFSYSNLFDSCLIMKNWNPRK